MAGPRDYELTFTGAGTQPVNASGRYVRILEAPSAAVFVEIDGGSELKRVAGQAIFDADGFSRLRIRSTVAQTVLLTVSDQPQDDNQQTVNANVSATIGPGDTLTSTADVSVAGVTTAQVIAGRADRLSVTVKNLNGNASPVRVGDSLVAAGQGHELMPGESITLDTTSPVSVYNSDAAAQSVSVLEVRDV